MRKTENIQLWEIMRDGKHGEVFEVVSCPLDSFKGHKIKVHAKANGCKCLVRPEAVTEGADELVTLYGCLGGANFKKVEEYITITLEDALNEVRNLHSIYIKNSLGVYTEITQYSAFRLLGIDDMSDLLRQQFYKVGA